MQVVFLCNWCRGTLWFIIHFNSTASFTARSVTSHDGLTRYSEEQYLAKLLKRELLCAAIT